MPDGQQVPATGRRVDVPFCQVAHIRDGKVQGAKLYYGSMTLLGQLGLLPQGQAAPSNAR
jgi:hypothetical protein